MDPPQLAGLALLVLLLLFLAWGFVRAVRAEDVTPRNCGGALFSGCGMVALLAVLVAAAGRVA